LPPAAAGDAEQDLGRLARRLGIEPQKADLDSGGWLVSDDIKIDIDVEVAESQEAVEESADAEARQPA
jgi:hypothetical protein